MEIELEITQIEYELLKHEGKVELTSIIKEQDLKELALLEKNAVIILKLV